MSEYVEAEWVVMIRLFGPPDAVNRSGVGLGDIGRGKPLELLAWLVTHRDVATRDGAREALWGGDDVAARTMSNALWGARTLLRKLADEPNEEFITSSNGRLQLSGKVVSDYERVADRLAFARRPVGAAAATEALDGGLHLVRGAPLAGEKWLWADENHLSTNLAMLGSAIATELAAQRLKAGQTDTAIEATTVGLEVIPNNEELIRLRMQACIDGGDRRAALNVYEKYVGATTARGESIGPEIAALRNELLRTGLK
jgi:two-component SAPR family response regulator